MRQQDKSRDTAALDGTHLLQARRDYWKRAGLIQREIPDLGSLLDLYMARGEFVRALGITPAWTTLIADASGITTVDQAASLAAQWLKFNRMDAIWLHHWASRVVIYAAALLRSGASPSEVVIDRVLLDDGLIPEPNLSGLLSLYVAEYGWQGDEPPPDPINETREEFFNRMGEAWDSRCDLIGWSRRTTKRDLETHARWFVRHHMLQETVNDILSNDDDEQTDTSTVRKALRSFPVLIELSVLPSQ